MIFDISERGLLTLFKLYQAALIERIWELNKPGRTGITSGKAYEYLKSHPDSKSRDSVINFVNEIVEEGVFEYEEESGKGGWHRVYYPKMNREQSAKYVFNTTIDKLDEWFSTRSLYSH